MLVYVDDLVLGAAKQIDMEWIKAALTKAFEMTDLHKLMIFLSLEITRDGSPQQLAIHKRRNIEQILERHGMNNACPISTPLEPHTRLPARTQTDGEDNQIKEVSIEAYQSAVGSILYTMLGTCLDIAYTVALVSQFNHAPQWEHWIAIKRVFRYLGATRDLGLRYGASNISGGYSNAD